MSNMERRDLPASLARVEVRKKGDKDVIWGYAAVYYRAGNPGTEFWLYDDIVERFVGGAFRDTVASPAAEEDVAGLFNHNHNMPLGMRSAGTVSLFEDDIGLGYEIDPPDTQAGRDLVTNLRRKDVKGSSLSFFVAGPHARRGKVVWAEEHVEGRGAVMVREIHSATVLDVGPATIPAYSGTSSGLRSRWEGQGREHLLAEAAAACRRRGPGLEELDMRVRLAQLECEHRTRRADSLL